MEGLLYISPARSVGRRSLVQLMNVAQESSHGSSSFIFAESTPTQWRGEYNAALLGLDRQTLLERVAAAETVILARLPAFATGPEGRRERQIIEDSLRFLRVLKNDRV